MDTAHLLHKEFKLRVFDESYPRVEKCLRLLTQEQIWRAPNENITCVGCLVKHLLGNAQQWVYSGVLNHEFDRNRDGEFVPEPEMTAEDLLNAMKDVRNMLEVALEKLSEADLEKLVVIQGFETTGFSAIIHVIEHFSYHTGQISLLTKMFENIDLGYYDDHDLDV